MTWAIYMVFFILFLITALNLLPTAPLLPTSIWTGIHSIIAQGQAWNGYFPINTMLQIVGLVVVYELSIFGWHVLKLMVKWLHPSGS